RGDIRKEMPEVDAIVGTNELDSIVALCEGLPPAADPLQPYLYHDLTPRVLATPRHFAYMKIAEGCDHPCTFCVIPQYRGAFRSRRFESVISEATRLFQQGVREINLIGQDTTCYGEDFGLKDGLADLLERIRRTIPGVAIRTSFIVGFPGETAQDFEELCRFVEAARFDNLGVFTYSDEDTSGSYALDGKVDGRTIHNRKRHLMAIQRKIA